MSRTIGHQWRDGVRGRSIKTVQFGHQLATLTCSKCSGTGNIRFREIASSDQIDRKFRQAGWDLDPAKCLSCRSKKKEPKEMATTAPTPAALVAQGKMHRLLEEHFVVENGRYEQGWDDARVSRDTGLAQSLVTEYRRACFGEIRLPTEVEKLRDDLAALVKLKSDSDALFAQSLAELQSKVGDLTRRFAA